MNNEIYNAELSLLKTMKKATMKGGKRPGAGRPKGEPTTTIAFRVKLKHAEELKQQIKELIKNK